MAGKGTRLSKIAREFNVGLSTIVEFLNKKGYNVDPNPNTKVSEEIYDILVEEYSSDISVKKESDRLSLQNLREKKDSISINDIDQQRPAKQDSEEEVFIKDPTAPSKIDLAEEEVEIKVVGKVDLDKVSTRGPKKKDEDTDVGDKTDEETDKKPEKKTLKETAKTKTEPAGKTPSKKPAKKTADTKEETIIPVEDKTVKDIPETGDKPDTEKTKKKEDDNFIKTRIEKLNGPSVVGKIELPVEEKKETDKESKKKRKRIKKEPERRVDIGDKPQKESADNGKTQKKQSLKRKRKPVKPEVSEEDVQKQVKETLARLTDRGKSKAAKFRRE